MSSWWPSSGRYSPFAAYTSRGPPQVTPDDFTYLDSDRRPQGQHDHYHHNSTSSASGHGRNDSYGPPKHTVHPDLQLDPDILVLKHKGITYPLHFPAFAIAESLKVGELRWQAAKETKCEDPRRVKLLYKGRSLRDDSKQCREEGLKQNSELMCVVSTDATISSPRDEDGNESSSSASSAAMANGVGAVQQEPRSSRRKGHRSGGKRRGNRDTRFDDGPRDNYLAPPNGGPSTTDRSSSHDRPTTTTTAPTTMKPPSPQPGATPTTAPPPPAAAASAKKPTTPAEILQAVSDDFNTNFLPKVRSLLDHPPKNLKDRDYESKKLSEGILTQVLFKLDGVQTEDEGVKARRKECVKLANFWSGELDALVKK